MTKAEEKQFDVAEMRILRWMCGITSLERIRNKLIRGTQNWEKYPRKYVQNVVRTCNGKKRRIIMWVMMEAMKVTLVERAAR